ncbi:MAG: hypothetical protein AAGK32_06920 [Actinomycetota bacterium]
MPWCDACERFSNPNSLDEHGGCPTCGDVIAEAAEEERELKPVPWHFWLLVIAVTGYLGWRLIEGVIWLVGRF